MKTSNLLLLAAFGCMLIGISAIAISLKFQLFTSSITGSGNQIEIRHDIPEFSKIEVSNKLQIKFTQSDDYGLTVKADSNLHDAIDIRVEKNTLYLSVIKTMLSANPIEISVNAPSLTDIIINKGASFQTLDSLIQQTLTVNTTSGANVFIRSRIDSLQIETSAGSLINIEGYCNNLTVKSSSGSRVNADSLRVTNCIADASSGAIQNLCVSQTFDAIAETGAVVSYHGDPEIIRSEAQNGGQLNKK